MKDLRVSADVSPAAWIAPRLGGGFGAVARTVPRGYPAYARICHPATDRNGRRVTWADVAAATGRQAHRLMQWHALVGSRDPLSMADSVWRGFHPEQGNLAPDVLVALCEVLAGHSATAEDCYFCVWDGYGWIAGSSTLLHSSTVGAAGDREEAPAPAFSAEELSHPRVELPHRSYLLLAGALAAAAQIIWPPSASRRTSSGRPIGRGVPQASWTSTRPWSAARPS